MDYKQVGQYAFQYLKSAMKWIHQAHWYLAVLVGVNGLFLLEPLAKEVALLTHKGFFSDWHAFLSRSDVLAFPQAVTSMGLLCMSIGLALQARIAWLFSLLLLSAEGLLALWKGDVSALTLAYSAVVFCLLIVFWRRFNRSSLAASSLFATMSVAALLMYAVFGTLYLGNEFSPPITDMSTALYFSVVTMSTVGFGDILPVSSGARLLTTSIIVFGITVFATSISAIIGPVIGGSLSRIVKGRMSTVNRKNHYIIVGVSPLAHSIYSGLIKRDWDVTVIVPLGREHVYPTTVDIVEGDPSDADVLREAGIGKAKAILALRSDDAENAFIVLATKEIAPHVRTVALVNENMHLQKIRRVQPDVVFSPQLLASELLVRSLNGEQMDHDTLLRLMFDDIPPPPTPPRSSFFHHGKSPF